MGRILIVALLALAAGGCGYRLPGESPFGPEVRTLYVELLENRTLEPFLENGVTDHLVSEIARGGVFTVTDRREEADAVLSGEITGYSSGAIAYDRLDAIVEYRSEMRASAQLRRSRDGKALWKGGASWTEEYLASDDKALQEDNETAAIGVIGERLAEELYRRMLESF